MLKIQQCLYENARCFPGDSVVKNPLTMQETHRKCIFSSWVRIPLEKEMATHSSILAWEISWTEELDGLQSMLSQTVGHNVVTKQQKTQANGRWERNHFIFHKIERGKVTCLLLSPSVTPWTTAYQAPLSMEFSRHQYWRRLPFPSADK